ncbi:MAG: hypothetical protein MZU95_17590 [Desulfomicrobium escambiense]|nr:hypothetical protein [Desulfomicrobium escambiense]
MLSRGERTADPAPGGSRTGDLVDVLLTDLGGAMSRTSGHQVRDHHCSVTVFSRSLSLSLPMKPRRESARFEEQQGDAQP